MTIELKKIFKEDLRRIYKIQYSSEYPEWAKYNAPYFNEYKLISYDQFLISNQVPFLISDNVRSIVVNDEIVGIVTRYWENKDTRWLEVGIVIYDETFWNKGIALKVLKVWIDKCFIDFPEIERVGLATWSGNLGMMRVSEKLGMTLEARIRKARYYNNYYYDSIKYGILREEFYNLKYKNDVDCTFKFQDKVFNFRVGCIIINEKNEIFLTKNINEDYYFLPGGRVKFNETTADAVKRELLEELNLEVEDIKPLIFNENFFKNNSLNYHELATYYIVELRSMDNKLSLESSFVMNDSEGNKYFYEWISINNITNYNLKPKFLKNNIQDLINNYKVYFTINKD